MKRKKKINEDEWKTEEMKVSQRKINRKIRNGRRR
jgi:hypothetical protein